VVEGEDLGAQLFVGLEPGMPLTSMMRSFPARFDAHVDADMVEAAHGLGRVVGQLAALLRPRAGQADPGQADARRSLRRMR